MAAALGVESVAEPRGRAGAGRAIGWTIQRPRPRPRHARAAGPGEGSAFEKSSPRSSPGRPARHPSTAIETDPTDEHRIGLKPILRRVWAPRGERPTAVGHHRFEALTVTAFVSPATGEGCSSPLDRHRPERDFEDILALFARKAGAGRDRIIVLVLDQALGHTTPGLAAPEGLRLVHLPPPGRARGRLYTPELQPAKTLWVHLDEPIADRHFDALGLARCCRRPPARRSQRQA